MPINHFTEGGSFRLHPHQQPLNHFAQIGGQTTTASGEFFSPHTFIILSNLASEYALPLYVIPTDILCHNDSSSTRHNADPIKGQAPPRTSLCRSPSFSVTPLYPEYHFSHSSQPLTTRPRNNFKQTEWHPAYHPRPQLSSRNGQKHHPNSEKQERSKGSPETQQMNFQPANSTTHSNPTTSDRQNRCGPVVSAAQHPAPAAAASAAATVPARRIVPSTALGVSRICSR